MDPIIRTDCEVVYTTPSLSKPVLNVNCAANDSDSWHWKYFWSKTLGTPTVSQTQETVRSIIPTIVIAGEDTAVTGANHQIVMRTMFAYVADEPIPIKVNASMLVTMNGSSGVSDVTSFEVYTKVFKPDGELVSTIYNTTVGLYNWAAPSTAQENRSYNGILPATACPLVCFSWMRSVGTVKAGVASKRVYGTYDIEFNTLLAESKMSVADGSKTLENSSTFNFVDPIVIGNSFNYTQAYFTIYNKSLNDLHLYGDPIISGPDASDFFIVREYSQTVKPPDSVNSAGSTGMIVGFKPRSGAAGLRNAQLSILSNDPSNRPFLLNIKGNAVDGQFMQVYKDGKIVAPNSSTYGTNPEYFLKVLNGLSDSFTLTIRNHGTSDLLLNGSPLVFVDPNTANGAFQPEDFSITLQPTKSNLASDESTSFTIKFEPKGVGRRRARIVIPCNDNRLKYSYINPAYTSHYIVNLECLSYSVGQQLVVEESTGAAFTNNDSRAFPNAILAGEFAIMTFKIRNVGVGLLELSSFEIGKNLSQVYNYNAFDWATDIQSIQPIPAGGNATLSIKFKPPSSGSFGARFSFKTNDPIDNLFSINVVGTGLANTAAAAIVRESDGAILTAVTYIAEFGSVSVGAEASRTFTIRNTGSMDLTLTPKSVSGIHANNFSVTSQPNSSVAGGASTTFTLKFAPIAVGSYTTYGAFFVISTNDPQKPDIVFYLRGTGVAPIPAEIDIYQPAGTNITSGGTKNFGNVKIGEKFELTFTVSNNGEAPLNLSGTPLVSVSGTNAADFSITTQPSASVVGNSSTTFNVQFAPAGTLGGNRSAILSIPNNDSNENPFVINLAGTAVGPMPEIVVEQDGADIAHNGSKSFGAVPLGIPSSLTFVIRNIGDATLNLGTASITGTHATAFTITSLYESTVAANGTTALTLTFTPTGAVGNRTAAISIPNNDTNEAPFVINLTASVGVPDITVEHGGATIARNGTVDFGTQELGAPLIERTFTIRNTGNGDLILTGAAPAGYPDNTKLTFSGVNPSQFSTADVANPATVIPAGGTTTFIARFGANQVGTYAAKVAIASNDPDETPYEINLTGKTAQTAEISITDPDGNDLANNGSVNFGAVSVNSPMSLTFTVKSVLTGQLDLQTVSTAPRVSTGGTNSSEFVVTTQPNRYVNGGTSTTFTVRFTPTASGTRTAFLKINNNDSNENPFVINVSGSGVSGSTGSPNLLVYVPIAAGGYTPYAHNSTLNLAGIVGFTKYTEVTIKNNVTSAFPSLILTGSPRVAVSGPNAAEFTIAEQPKSPISPGGTTTFTIGFAPGSVGSRNATLTISHNDTSKPAYVLNLAGTSSVKPPKLAITPSGGLSWTPTNLLGYDQVHFGQLSHALEKVVTFTITNNGEQDLSLPQRVQIVSGYGDASSNVFSITKQCDTSVAPGGSTTFDVRFKYPLTILTTPIDYKVKLRINHNAPLDPGIGYEWNNPADFDVAVTSLPAQQILVNVNGQEGYPLANGGTSVFSATGIGASVTNKFRVENVGYINLNLNGTPESVSLSGANANDFSIVTYPTTPITGPYTRYRGPWLEVKFTPTGTGSRVAQLTIPSDDWTGSPYTINLNGNGLASVREIDIEQPAGSNVANNGSRDFGNVSLGFNNSLTFTIRNSGSGTLNLTGTPRVAVTGTHASEFSVTQQPLISAIGAGIRTSFVVRFTPSAVGSRSAKLLIPNDDNDENPFEINLVGNCVLPPTEISVEQPAGYNINNNGSKDFGNVLLGTNSSLSFTIRNSGTSPLSLTGTPLVEVVGSNDFSVTSQPASTVSPSSTSLFQVMFTPSAVGVRSAKLSILNNDADENPFEINVTGTAVVPQISVELDSINILTGGLRDLGSSQIGSPKFSTFVIRNSGLGNLNLTGSTKVSISGANAGDFSVTTQPVATVTPSNTANFVVRFTPSAAGARSAKLSIPSNDSGKNPFEINIGGTGLLPPPEITVEDQGANIITGGSKDFGNIALGSSISIPFEIRNTAAVGSANLELTGSPRATISGTHAGDFTITAQPSSSVSPTGSTTVVVTFTPSALLRRSAVLTINHNDNTGAENPFLINLSGNGALAPEMAVEELYAAVDIPTGGSYSFGSVTNGTSRSKTFKIRNTSPAGSGILQLTGTPIVEVKGSNAGDFAVTTQPSSSVFANNFVTFVVSFTPSDLGTRSAQLYIPNNDPNEHPYLININGTCQLAPPEISIERGGEIISGNKIHLGSLAYGRTDQITFTIKNIAPAGSQNLDLTNITITQPSLLPSAPASTTYTVITQPSITSIAPGGSTTFVVQVAPPFSTLNRTIEDVLQVYHNDNTDSENPYRIVLSVSAYTEYGTLAVKQPGGTKISSGSPYNFGSSTEAVFEILDDSDNAYSEEIYIEPVNNGPYLVGDNPSDFIIVNSGDYANAGKFFRKEIYSNKLYVPKSPPEKLKIIFSPTSQVGTRRAILRFAYTRPTGGGVEIFELHLVGIAGGIAQQAPAIAIEQPTGSNIAANGSVSFGTTYTGYNKSLTFAIRNTAPTGADNLIISNSNLQITGANAGEFSITTLVVNNTSVIAQQTWPFIVKFTPTVGATGNRNATLSITSNASNGSPFLINLTGVAALPPKLVVERAGTNIANSGQHRFNQTYFNRESSLTFTIRNTGASTLNLTGASPVVRKPSNWVAFMDTFTVTTQPTLKSIAPGASTTFEVKCAPKPFIGSFYPMPTGDISVDFEIHSDDPSANPFLINFIVNAAPHPPEIRVDEIPVLDYENSVSTNQAGTEVISGASWNFGTIHDHPQSGQIVYGNFRRLKITNIGPADGDSLAVLPKINNPYTNFWISNDSPATGLTVRYIRPQESYSFAVEFRPSGVGSLTDQLNIATNDLDENPFVINLSGTHTAPQRINVLASSGNFYYPLRLGESFSKTIEIRNMGTEPLNLTGTPQKVYSVSEAVAGDFTITRQPSVGTIPALGSTTFQVQFQPRPGQILLSPAYPSQRYMTIEIPSNDPATPIARLTLIGTVLS